MKRWMAAILAILTVILSSVGGIIVGAIVGYVILPFQLFAEAGNPDAGLGVLVGAILGLLGGFFFGIWAAMGILDEVAPRGRLPKDPPKRDPGSLDHGSR